MTAPRINGCPQACGNTELPWFLEAVPGAVRATYTCTDCGERWTTDWRLEHPYDTGVLTCENTPKTWENKSSPAEVRQTPRPGSDRLPVMEGGGW